ncbi:hypothetical protein LP420_30785 [Massilia sp. B-10]|nr:hypothetical protein LP420_30785 [Massilia sp. B-10]
MPPSRRPAWPPASAPHDSIVTATSGARSGNAVLTVATLLPPPVVPPVPAPGTLNLGAASSFAVLA